MPVDDDSVLGRLTSRASLDMCVGWVKRIVHISHGMKSLSLKTGSPDPMLQNGFVPFEVDVGGGQVAQAL